MKPPKKPPLYYDAKDVTITIDGMTFTSKDFTCSPRVNTPDEAADDPVELPPPSGIRLRQGR